MFPDQLMRLLAELGNLGIWEFGNLGCGQVLLFVFGISLVRGGLEDASIVVVASVIVFVVAAIKNRNRN